MSGIFQPGPFHILSYGTLLGASLFQSLIGGVTAYKVLPRAQFSQLQKALFPIYFSMQSVLALALFVTYPTPSQSVSGSLKAVLAHENRYSAFLPLTIMVVCNLANWAFLGPATAHVMKERKHQETRDGKKYFDPGPQSDTMKSLNKQFGVLHGVSSLVNMISVAACLGYGWVLGQRI